MLVTSREPRALAKGESILLSVGRSWPTSATSTGKSAHPTDIQNLDGQECPSYMG
ncbi:hypothetical protein RE6C_05434 [Rhodopirellula europaea 6C]|uniref:Uncharacterized protein n=1 Tax=Rhodopirellula europaea 6C TaxID=1263867 RepID=M2A3N4_9BACT|nr:hypothetical protein RE6C_05434 [Rhodopirellula europaea 6C]